MNNPESKPFTVSLQGGLGNQLFQYAFGRAWSLRNNVPVIFDEYGFQFDSVFKRTLSLENFSIPSGLKKSYSRHLFQLARFLKHFGKIGIWLGKRFRPQLLIEESHQFESSMIKPASLNAAYAFGYWQDEQYFADSAKIIREDLRLTKPFSAANELLREEIVSTPDAVALHIRRLHQVSASNEQVPLQNGEEEGIILSAQYYLRAISYIESFLPNANYFIFSDYPNWAQENLVFKNRAKFLEASRGPDYEDLVLISLCRHHIIANSSFSWWGAWLGSSDTQIVVAPAHAKLLPNIPAGWIRV